MSQNTDLRVVKTQKNLWESLVKLVVDKGYGQVSVMDICKESQVNRSTFYRHFEDKEDLLLRRTDEILFQMAMDSRHVKEVAESRSFTEYGEFLQIILDHRDFFRIMLGGQGEPQFVDKIMDYLQEVTALKFQQWELNLNEAPVPKDLFLSYIAGAHLYLLKWWINSREPCSIDELISYNVTLFTQDPYSILGVDIKAIMEKRQES